MEIFISWSGPRSGVAAELLRNWLPKIINAVRPWLSTSDIDKGARWGVDVASRLQAAKAGIICLTPSNIHSDWLLFEAGALSKTLENTFVCPFLIGIEPADVKGPLAQFQATRAVKTDIFKLLKTLNAGLNDAALPLAHLEEAFEVWLPRLEAELKKLPPDEAAVIPYRSERDLLEEVLGLVRSQNRSSDLILSQDDRKQIIQGRVWKVIHSTGMSFNSSTTKVSGAMVEVELRAAKGKKILISIPLDTPLDEIEPQILPQIPSAVDDASQDGPSPPAG